MALATDVWVIYPGRCGSRFKPGRDCIRDECKKRGWKHQERASTVVNIRPGGRTREVLPGIDATTIYRRAHRARVGVIVFAPTHVFLHPTQEDAIRRNLIARVQGLFQYKCFVELLDNKTACTTEWVQGFADRFQSAGGLQNEYDPRCLPLHVFSNNGQHRLLEIDGRAEFDKRYGSGAKRVDDDGRRWALSPRAYHGHDQLYVAGSAIPRGFHWDVQPHGDSTLIVTTAEVWVVARYVNIYPDSHVRGERPHAKKVV